MDDVLAYKNWRTNADLIWDVCKLWVEPDDHELLDATYGLGNWWNRFGSKHHYARLMDTFPNLSLRANDADDSSPAWWHQDFRDFQSSFHNRFDIVCYDPPYKLNGRPSESDKRYGCGEMKTVAERLELIERGFFGCMRVTKPGGLLWVKVMDQVVGGQVVWQTQMIHKWAERVDAKVIDRFDMIRPPRPQKGEQQHARRNASTLLIIQKPA